MPTQARFASAVIDDDGNFVEGAAVVVVDAGTSTSRGTDTSDSSGEWDITPSGGGPQYDVTITSGGKVIRWFGRDKVQVETVQIVSPDAGLYGLAVARTEDAAEVEVALFEGDRPQASAADGDAAYNSFLMSDDAGNQEEVARVTWTQNDVNPSADGGYKISVAVAGSLTDALVINVTNAGVHTNTFAAGVVSVDDTTDSTSGTTGSIHTDGGLGVVKSLWVGGTLSIESTVPQFRFTDTNASADEGDWEFVALADASFNLRALTEAGEAGGGVFSVTRTGTAIDEFSFASGVLVSGTGQIILSAEDEMWIGPAAASGNQTNGDVTTGLTINQEAADDAAFALKSSDVAHLITSQAETDTYFNIRKGVAVGGGVAFRILGEQTGDTSYLTTVIGGTATTTKTTSGVGLVNFNILEQDGSGNLAAITANGNIFSVRCRVGGGEVTRFLVDEDGDIFVVTAVDVTGSGNAVAATAFDDMADAELARAFDLARSPASTIRTEFDDFVRYKEQDLIDAGILGDTIENGGLWNLTQHTRLLNGAVWQGHTRQLALESRIEEVERKLLTAGG